MRSSRFCILILSIAACAVTKPDPLSPPDPQYPDPTFGTLSPGVVQACNYVLTTGEYAWIDFQSGKIYTKNQLSDPSVLEAVDAGLALKDGSLQLVSANKTYKTRMKLADDVVTPAKYGAIRIQNDISQCMPADISSAPFQIPVISSPCYIAFKTYSPSEGNLYGVIEVEYAGASEIVFNYKSEAVASGPHYSGARKVTVSGGSFYVDGKPYYVNGAAATMHHTMMAEYGANTCRVYTIGTSASSFLLLDSIYEAGLMLYAGLPCTSYASLNPSTPNYDDPEFRKEKIASILKIVQALKDHPAVLCWCLGNEVEGSGHQYDFGIYAYYGELAKEIRKIDSNHPITAAFTETPTAKKVGLITTYCPDLDFLSFNSYYNFLYDHRDAISDNYTTMLENYGWTKPYMITEYGPTGTWQRKALKQEGRINDWGALIQLSSDEAAQRYIDCYKLIKDYRNCLGAFAFWWGYQTHGQVLGWYPTFTKEHYVLPVAEAMESCWRGCSYNPESPRIQSWKSSIELNGRNAAGAQWSSSGQEEKNPVLTAGQACTARVYASCRSGNPSTSLKYKWFIYKDCNYYHVGSDKDWTSVTYDSGEYVYDPSGQHMAMDEDARATLFKDRTLKEVEFTAPSAAGNYRLYVIVSDPSNNTAASVCLNFKVE